MLLLASNLDLQRAGVGALLVCLALLSLAALVNTGAECRKREQEEFLKRKGKNESQTW